MMTDNRSGRTGRKPAPANILSSRKTERKWRSRPQGTSSTGRWSEQGSSRPTTILAKPQSQKLLVDESEEWPSIVASAATPTVVDRLQQSSSGKGKSKSPDRSGSVVKTSHLLDNKPLRIVSSRAPEIDGRRNASDTSNICTSGQYANKNFSAPSLKAATKLISENMEWTDFLQEYLHENSDYTVIGAIGAQGCGKSTVLSMIGGNATMDMYRQYIFRPASREAMETCRHQTGGIQVYITKTRVILLDCQAMFSAAILEEMLHSDKRYNYEFKTVENYTEIESIQLIAFLLQVCHTVLICVDWFVDLQMIRLVRTAEMLRAGIGQSAKDHLQYDPVRAVNIVLLHQRAKFDDFKPTVIRTRAQTFRRLFDDSQLNIFGSVSLANTELGAVKDGKNELINYYLLSDMKLRGKTSDGQLANLQQLNLHETTTRFRNVPTYEELISHLRKMIFSLPRAPFLLDHTFAFSEKAWYNYAAKIWDSTRKSHIISEYGRFLP